jgi:hypothetical protein
MGNLVACLYRFTWAHELTQTSVCVIREHRVFAFGRARKDRWGLRDCRENPENWSVR